MVILYECVRLVGLPNNFGTSVPKLKRLEMSKCRNLKTLPSSIVLKHLIVLDLTDCDMTCLWENDANTEVKELLCCQWIGDT